MGNRASGALVVVLAIATAACGGGAAPSTVTPSTQSSAPGAAASMAGASTDPATSAAGGGAIVAGTFKSGRAQMTFTGAHSGPADMPNLGATFGASGSTGTGPGYKWYAEGADGIAVTIRFPSDPVSNGTTTSLPKGTGIQVEFDLLASTGDLFSSSTGECTVSFDQNDATALRGRLDCHGIKASQDPSKTVDATGTFEAKP
jgi:hypothetical protein